MYVSRVQLEEAYRALDSASIQSKLLSGGLTAEARDVAIAELAARKLAGEIIPHAHSAAAAMPTPLRRGSSHRTAAKVLLGLYIAFVVLCLLVLLVDPPWGAPKSGAYAGMLGLIASSAAGFPWSFILPNFAAKLSWPLYLALNNHPLLILYVCWLGALINFGLFWFYFRKTR